MESRYELPSKKMVQEQLISRGISDAQVLKAMEEAPRHLFVPEQYSVYAYADTPVPIGYDQTISQPYIVAFMLEAAHLKRESRVLEIGAGSGYVAYLLSKIVSEVFAIERIHEIAVCAKERLQALHCSNVTYIEKDGSKGLPELAPFDAIIVSACFMRYPHELLPQLKVGGVLVAPLLNDMNDQVLTRITRVTEDSYHSEILSYVRFVPIIEDNEK